MSIELTKIDDVTGARATVVGKWDETIKAIDNLDTKAAKFTVSFMGDELDRFKRQFRAAANKIGRTARFGQDAQDGNGNTTVQVKLVDKVPGRPVGSGNAPKAAPKDEPTPKKK